MAKRALAEKRRVAEIVLDEKLLTPEQLDHLLRLEAMTAPSRPIAIPSSKSRPTSSRTKCARRPGGPNSSAEGGNRQP